MLSINKNFLKSHKCYVGENNPKYIVMHETDNWSNGAGANAHARAHYNGNLGSASVHYYVDDKEIYQTLRHEDGPWAVGDNRGYSDITNRNSINIELCVNPDSNYEVARDNAIELCAYLLKQYGFSIDRLKTHNNASGKHCPRRILDENYWNIFKEKVANLLNGSSNDIQENNSNDYDYSVKNKYGVVTGNEVRVRDAANLNNSNILGYKNKGDKVKIGFGYGDFYNIFFGDHGGWIHKSYVKIEENQVSEPSSIRKEYAQSGNATVLVDKLNVRTNPSINAEIVASYEKGETIYNYNRVYEADGYRWIRYMGASGNYRYVAVRELATNKKYANCY